MNPLSWRFWLLWSVMAGLVFGLGGCAAAPKARTVLVPIREACVPKDVAAAPASYPDERLPTGADSAPERMLLRAAANERRKARLAILEPVVAACR